MKVFRNKKGLVRAFSLFTGAIFLNMSFFLAEVRLLKITDKDIIENVCKLVLNGGLEEERDAHSGGSDAPVNVFSPANDLHMWRSSLFLIGGKSHLDPAEHYLHADHSTIFSPPPEPSFS